MGVDRVRVGEFAMEALDSLVEHYEDMDVGDLEIADLMLIVAFNRPSREDPDDRVTDVVYYAEDHVTYRQLGLLHGAVLSAEMAADE